MLHINNLLLPSHEYKYMPQEFIAAHKDLLTAAYDWEKEHQAIMAGPMNAYSVIELKNVYMMIHHSVKKANDFAVYALGKYRSNKKLPPVGIEPTTFGYHPL